jgi:hypothetical protein
MAAGAGGLTDKHGEAFIRDAERDVLKELRDRLKDAPSDTIRVKAHYLDDDVPYSNTRVGHAIGRLAQANTELTIERWTAPTTTPILWEVKR